MVSVGYGLNLGQGVQDGTEDSFVGGQPRLPAGEAIPVCELCGAALTYFLQLAIPSDHEWHGSSLAIFACTSCADERHLVPEMIDGPLPGAAVASEFLRTYQRNFRLLVFPTKAARLVTDYQIRVLFRPMMLTRGTHSSLGQVGGRPDWLLEDESPGSIDGTRPFIFLLQLGPNVQFQTVPGAPAQMELGLDGTPGPSPESFYQLFIGNSVYFFGPEVPATDAVYVVTQVD